MALAAYLAQTRRLLQNPAAPVGLYSDADLTTYINEARTQAAAESGSIRRLGSLALTPGNRGAYSFLNITFDVLPAIGVQGVVNVRTIWYLVGSGQKWLRPRPFEWFSLFELNNAAPQQGPPKMWSQYDPGLKGLLYFNTPDQAYTLTLDTVCYPVPLVDDSTPEALPPLWTTAIPYYAAYLALLSSQTGARTAEADKMMERYTEFAGRARAFATPGVLPTIYPQTPNPVAANQLGSPGAAPGGR
jgi:hypothetical protein